MPEESYYGYYGSYVFERGIAVAVLDTGIDYTHPDLYGRVAYCIYTAGTNTCKGTNLKNCADRNRRGRQVAGVIAALVDNASSAGAVLNAI